MFENLYQQSEKVTGLAREAKISGNMGEFERLMNEEYKIVNEAYRMALEISAGLRRKIKESGEPETRRQFEGMAEEADKQAHKLAEMLYFWANKSEECKDALNNLCEEK